MSHLLNAPLNRRKLVGSAAGICGLSVLPWGRHSFSRSQQEPHFFLHICVSGGVDTTYTFDARQLSFTDRGILQNYGYRNADPTQALLPDPEPRRMIGQNGGSTLRSPLTDGLVPFFNDITVVNGVLMSPVFNGHGSNMYHLFSNSSAPSDSFVPFIGSTGTKPIQSIHFGGFEGDGNRAPTNFSTSVQLQYGQGSGLAADVVGKRRVGFDSPVMGFVKERLRANSQGQGLFSKGAGDMGEATLRAPELGAALNSVGTIDPNENEILATLDVALAYFRGGVTQSVTLMYDRDPVIDTHAAANAQQQVVLYQEIMTNLGEIIGKLKATPFDEASGKSFLDVTTVLISSEFSRTMRSMANPNEVAVDATGTDHNPLTNTLILAGRGIKTGQVIGSSDLMSHDESGGLLGISGAHRFLDPALIQIMGRPFDHVTGQSIDALPEVFRQADYLNVTSVVNTLMSLFNVPADKHFRLGNQAAPLLRFLLS